jgi:hypothetical protein
MQKSRFRESQIVKVFNEHEVGKGVGDITWELGIIRATFYNWRKK